MALSKPQVGIDPATNAARIATAFDAIDANTASAQELRQDVDTKADASTVAGVRTDLIKEIADRKTAVGDLSGRVDSKADTATVSALSQRVDTKADGSSLQQVSTIVQGKVDATAFDRLAAIVAQKGDATAVRQLQLLVSQKSNSTTVAALQAVVAKLSPNTGLALYGVRPGEYPRAWSHMLDGRPETMQEVEASLAVSDSDGYVLRLVGPQTLASMAAEKVVQGRRYPITFTLRRRVDTTDPANDSVRLMLRCLNRFWRASSIASVVLKDVNDLKVSDGARTFSFVACTTPGEGVDIVIPPSAVYFRAALQKFGQASTTDDVEVMGLVPDGPGVLNADTAAFEARLTQVQNTVQADDAANRLAELESNVGGAKIRDYLTLDDVRATRISETVDVIRVSKWALNSSTCLATYARIGQAPTDHIAWVESADGAIWELTVAVVDPRMLGVTEEDSLANHMRMQAALDYAGARCHKIAPPKMTVQVWRSLLFDSGVTMDGVGTGSLFEASASFDGSVHRPTLLMNRNYEADVLTDYDITIRNIATDYGTYTVPGGGAHAIYMFRVDRPLVEYVYGRNGENVTAYLGCRDSKVQYCTAEDVQNCAFDAWNGAGDHSAIFNTIRGSEQQAVQWSGASTELTAEDSSVALIAFNRAYGVRNPSGYATAYISNAVAKGASTSRTISIGNYAEDCDNGRVFSGAGGLHVSLLDTFKGVDKGPILIQAESYADNSTAVPSNIRIIDPHLIDCDHVDANIALISISGGGEHEVASPKITVTSGPALYNSLIWLAAGTSNCSIRNLRGPTGSGARVVDQGSNNFVHDLDFDRGEEVFGAFTRHKRGAFFGPAGGNSADAALSVFRKGLWQPTLRIGGSADGISYATRSGRWMRIGDLVTVEGAIGLSSKGANVGTVSVSGLPYLVAGSDPVGGTITNFFNVVSSGALPVLLSGNVMQLKAPAPNTTVIDLSDVQLRDATYLFFTINYLTGDP